MIGLSGLFQPRDEDTAKAVVAWWERRRLIYNILLAPYTLLVVVAMLLRLGARSSLPDFSSFTHAVALMFGMTALFVIPANLWYIGGGWRNCSR